MPIRPHTLNDGPRPLQARSRGSRFHERRIDRSMCRGMLRKFLKRKTAQEFYSNAVLKNALCVECGTGFFVNLYRLFASRTRSVSEGE